MKKQKRLKATHFSRDWRMACINNLGESTNSVKFLPTKKLDWTANAYQNKWPRELVIQPGQKLFEVLWNAEVRKAVEENTAGQGTLQWIPAKLVKGHNSSWKLRPPSSCLSHSWKTKQTSNKQKTTHTKEEKTLNLISRSRKNLVHKKLLLRSSFITMTKLAKKANEKQNPNT